MTRIRRFLRYLRPKAETVMFVNGIKFIVGGEELVL